MATTLCASGAIVLKAGANATSALSEAQYVQLINQAEAVVCVLSRVDWVANYSTLGANYKIILEEVTSNLAAQYMIEYDMSGFTTRYEAETMLDVLNNGINRGLSLLKPAVQKDFLKDGKAYGA